ncbi:MAG: hypothetical protein IK115_07695 [Lachnospiraceae bacterium]|nr:hypothetical protein [Lachnospiraceae bacterium]
MKLERIRIGDRDLPIRIDYNVIEEIEEEFETLERFRMELLGFRWKRMDDGKYEYDDEGKPIPEITKPSMKAMNFILPLMINEGLKAEAYEQKKPYDPMDPEQILMECEIEKNYMLNIINREMERCQSVKKSIPGEENGKSKRRSTSPGSK